MRLAEILREMFVTHRKTGRRQYRTLGSGLTLCARVHKGVEVVTLSRAGSEKGPSTTEMHTVARHAGWADFGFRADPEAKSITVWNKPPALVSAGQGRVAS